MSVYPPGIAANPKLSRWIAVKEDGSIEFRSGKVELGQGITTAVTVLVANELKVPTSAVRVVSGDTRHGPDEGFTAGSLSLEQGGAAARWVAAVLRERLTIAASSRLNCPADAVRLEEGGLFTDGGNNRLSFGDLLADVDFDVDLTAEPAPQFISAWSSANVARVDLEAKLGGAGFIQDLQLPDMHHGRVLRPPFPGGKLVAFDKQAALKLDGVVCAVVDGSFVGIVAKREEDADRALLAASKLAKWQMKVLPPYDPELRWLSNVAPLSSTDVVQNKNAQSARDPTFTHRASYTRPYLAHASMAPSCALAEMKDGRLTVWSHAQGPFQLRNELASVLAIPAGNVEVVHAMGAGCYGHNGADDVALDAALLACASGVPVMCRWTRKDEMSWSPFGPAMRIDISASLDSATCISEWNEDVYSPPHLARPRSGSNSNLLAAWEIERAKAPHTPANVPGVSAGDRNAVPIYSAGSCRVTHHLLPQGPLRSSALRSLGAFANVFAIESFMDELAEMANVDAVQFRLRNLADPRARSVIAAVTEKSGWIGRPRGGEGTGWGFGFARYKNSSAYCAIVAAVEVSDFVQLRSIWAAVDCGAVAQRNGVLNQIEGGIIQAASWTLKEEVKWNESGIITENWESYPVLGFSESPEIFVSILDQAGSAPLGVGECAAGPTAAAIGNALANALGVRIRDLPFSRERLHRALSG